MAEIVVYSTRYCPYCVRAKALLTRKQMPFTEIMVDSNELLRAEMVAKSGRRTVPQIFINQQPIGGFDELWALDTAGKLDSLLREP